MEGWRRVKEGGGGWRRVEDGGETKLGIDSIEEWQPLQCTYTHMRLQCVF